ncbi:MAG TPA: response regulator [Fimbriimonas sp.]|nr:response regulator [Fimbriimonas sp.]
MERAEGPIVLVVEDNADDEALSCRAIRQQLPSVQIAVARDGQIAVECTSGVLSIADEEVQAVPDLVLLDLKLPKVTGLDVLRAIRKSPSMELVPVVVFSSSDQRQEVNRAYALGANSYVRKPTAYDEYLATVRGVTHYWFQVSDLPDSPAASA